MENYYEVWVKYRSTNEKMALVSKSEQYLVRAESCMEAEARVIALGYAEAEVTKVALSKYREYIDQYAPEEAEGLGLFGAKVSLISLDENSGRERKSAQHMLVSAHSVEDTNRYVARHMALSLSGWEINSITETKIVEVIG